MKTTKKHDRGVKAIFRDKKVRQYQAGSQSSEIGLICDNDKKVDVGTKDFTKPVAYTSASDFVILVRESPKHSSTSHDMRGNSEESVRKNMEDTTSYIPKGDVSFYPDSPGTATKTGGKDSGNCDQSILSHTEQHISLKADKGETDYQQKGKENTRNIYPRVGEFPPDFPKHINDDQDISTSSEALMRRNFEDETSYIDTKNYIPAPTYKPTTGYVPTTSYIPTSDISLYPDCTGATTNTGQEEGKTCEQAALSRIGKKSGLKTDMDENDHQHKGKKNKRGARFLSTTIGRNPPRSMCGLQFRCILYFTIACCASILFACLLAYFSYKK